VHGKMKLMKIHPSASPAAATIQQRSERAQTTKRPRLREVSISVFCFGPSFAKDGMCRPSPFKKDLGRRNGSNSPIRQAVGEVPLFARSAWLVRPRDAWAVWAHRAGDLGALQQHKRLRRVARCAATEPEDHRDMALKRAAKGDIGPQLEAAEWRAFSSPFEPR
jgi:hypothetical protein